MLTENRNHGPKHKNSFYVGVLDAFYATVMIKINIRNLNPNIHSSWLQPG